MSEVSPPAGGGDQRRGLLVLGLLGLVVALLAGTVYLGYGAWQRHQATGARDAAVQAARQTVLNFVSISAATIDRDLERVSEGATGKFREEFDAGKPRVKETVLDAKVKSTGRVLEAAVVESDRDSAQVLVVVDGTVVNKNAPKGQLRHYRIKVDMAKEDDAWRVAELNFVG